MSDESFYLNLIPYNKDETELCFDAINLARRLGVTILFERNGFEFSISSDTKVKDLINAYEQRRTR